MKFLRGTLFAIASSFAMLLAGCSVYMEATRPTPVALDDYQVGQSRDSVLERLGAPESTATESDGASCDFYRLYTKGYGAGGKIPLAVAEGAADVFTLGLAEIVLTPTEGVTKNEKHPVAMCYKDNKIARINTDTGPTAESAQSALATPPAPATAAAGAPIHAGADTSGTTAGQSVAAAMETESASTTALGTSKTEVPSSGDAKAGNQTNTSAQ